MRTLRPSRDRCLSELVEPCAEPTWCARAEFFRGGTSSSNPPPSSGESTNHRFLCRRFHAANSDHPESRPRPARRHARQPWQACGWEGFVTATISARTESENWSGVMRLRQRFASEQSLRRGEWRASGSKEHLCISVM
jgi:hypothetical protein